MEKGNLTAAFSQIVYFNLENQLFTFHFLIQNYQVILRN